MLAMLLAAQAAATAPPPVTAIDAERAFAADAQKLGQWTAFRKWAADDARMFTPQPVNAQEFLKPLKDPPVAVFWWPGRSYVSCDGTYAVNTGPWVREWGKSVGYFTTVWQRQPDGGWKWIYDAGDELPAARAEGGDIAPTQASCDSDQAGLPPFFVSRGSQVDTGRSPDRTLVWHWEVKADGSRRFRAFLWDGKAMQRVIDDQVAAPPAQ